MLDDATWGGAYNGGGMRAPPDASETPAARAEGGSPCKPYPERTPARAGRSSRTPRSPRPIPRAEARTRLRLELDRRYLLFPADPDRVEKRFDRAQAVAQDHRLLVLGRVAPSEVPYWVNAADAVLVTSDRESFGLSVLEALACDVPVLATDVGIAPEALADVPGTLHGAFSLPQWRSALETVLQDPDPRVNGRVVAERYSADRMAACVLEAWRGLL